MRWFSVVIWKEKPSAFIERENIVSDRCLCQRIYTTFTWIWFRSIKHPTHLFSDLFVSGFYLADLHWPLSIFDKTKEHIFLLFLDASHHRHHHELCKLLDDQKSFSPFSRFDLRKWRSASIPFSSFCSASRPSHCAVSRRCFLLSRESNDPFAPFVLIRSRRFYRQISR